MAAANMALGSKPVIAPVPREIPKYGCYGMKWISMSDSDSDVNVQDAKELKMACSIFNAVTEVHFLSVGTKMAGPSWWLTLLPKFVESISAAEHAERGLRLSL